MRKTKKYLLLFAIVKTEKVKGLFFYNAHKTGILIFQNADFFDPI